jgi:prepilin-type N-terminal cleavage/methylation domain-containing protein
MKTMKPGNPTTTGEGDGGAAARRRRRARMRSRAFTLIELLIVLQVIMILASIALPGLKTTRKAANETTAVLALRSLSDAQELYRPRQFPPHYAASLAALRQAGLIDSALATGHKSGYTFLVNGDPTNDTYAFTATASTQASSGDRSFYVDQSGIIRMAPDASVSITSDPLR